MAESSIKIDLSEQAEWATFVIGGHEFQCEVFDTVDRLAEIDYKHAKDKHLCLDCGAEFIQPPSAEGESLSCAACHSGRVRPSQLFLDSVSDMLRSQFGVPRVSRTEAGKFYSVLVQLRRDLKKNIS